MTQIARTAGDLTASPAPLSNSLEQAMERAGLLARIRRLGRVTDRMAKLTQEEREQVWIEPGAESPPMEYFPPTTRQEE